MMNNQNTNSKTAGTTEAKENKYLDVETIPFDGILKSKITTSVKIAQLISGMFKGAISDFDGTILLPNQQGGFDVTLFFKESRNPAGVNQVQAIRRIGTGNRTSTAPIDRLNLFNTKNSNKAYELTEDIKEILSEFIYVRGNNKSINWNNHVAEQTENLNYNGGYSVYVTVGGLDIIRILRKIYGAKNGKSKLDYNLSLLKPVGAVSGFTSNYLVNIQQLDNAEVEKLALEAGLVGTVNTLPIIR